MVTQENNIVMKDVLSSIGENMVDKMADALVEITRFADSTVKYPELDDVKQDNGVMPEWFYPIYNGVNGFSELDAIHLYTSQEQKFEPIGNLLLGIALVEMKHYGILGELIIKLGGRIEQRYNNSKVSLGETKEEALNNAIDAENKTIEFYEGVIEKIKGVRETKTTIIVVQLVNKLIADERVHLKLLKEQKDNL